MLTLRISSNGRVLTSGEIKKLAEYLVFVAGPSEPFGSPMLEPRHTHLHLDLKNGSLVLSGCTVDMFDAALGTCPYARKGVEL